MSKVCERSAHSQLMHFLDTNGIISQSQSGNRKFHSTETALLHFTDESLKNMDDKKISMIVLLDMSKAFDSICHDLLLLKLHNMGVSDAARAWFESYLTQRNQVVKMVNTLSEPLPLTVGVPQGPVLFTLYANDLLSVLKHCKVMGYVDDTTLFLALPPSQISDAVSALNQDLMNISNGGVRTPYLLTPIRRSS